VVLARTELVDSGVVECTENASVQQAVKRGTSLGIFGKASNKGAVGLPIRIGDQRLAVVTCHLASDSSGKNKVEKRNKDSQGVLSDLSVGMDDSQADLHHSHHHVVFCGDLNYRIVGLSPDECLDKIVDASVGGGAGGDAEAGGETKDNVDATTITVKSSNSSNEAETVEKAWLPLLLHEELRKSMGERTVFNGYREGPIAFPPTYRRVAGEDGARGGAEAYCDRESVAGLYTTSVVKKKTGKASPRVPSWTDRVLWHSMPGVAGQLRLRRYWCLDEGPTASSGSDHRPICSEFSILLAARPNTTNATNTTNTALDAMGGTATHAPTLLDLPDDALPPCRVAGARASVRATSPSDAPKRCRCIIQVRFLSFEADGGGGGGGAGGGNSKGKTKNKKKTGAIVGKFRSVKIQSPIPAEDPSAQARKVQSLANIICFDGAARDSVRTARSSTRTSARTATRVGSGGGAIGEEDAEATEVMNPLDGVDGSDSYVHGTFSYGEKGEGGIQL
jgi:hypothetical protein